ncbi:unnamed protein product [Rotaria sordida]|uniref:Peroxide-inducible transcript 1 protein n=1 Tax=Rotaria sordida TaxID=392033 RepID=A0A814X9Z7_9BILA|nr:unnamed protein product [Rotaria sordida]CAF1065177.1 unnamed protein product [Rotaria sordida]CAF1215726.1 unnamed protein product [Rotaria sordida]CAF1216517.1 unnamed protein product [Rotaria sordida]CAF1228439.1 unnamed protein product [Rotaria sordida]
MDQRESVEQNKTLPISDIDQLCNLIDESTLGGSIQGSSYKSSNLSLRFRSVPTCQVKAFRSSRLKRLNSSSISKIQEQQEENDDDDNNDVTEKVSCRSLVPYARRTLSMRFSLSSPSLLNRFRSLSTCHFPQTRRNTHLSSNIRSHHIRYSSPTTITLFRTKSILPSIIEEESNIDNHSSSQSQSQSQLSCTIVDTRRPAANSCNVEELAAYLDNFLYLPKSLSGAAELMYT